MNLQDWIRQDLSRFVSGEWEWARWGNWLAVNGRRLAVELDRDWFVRIKADPQAEIPALLNTAGVTVTPYRNPHLIKRDPIEDDPKYADIISSVNEEADKFLEDLPHSFRGMGACHVLWAEKKRILKDRYGIDWQSPNELNPNMIFD